MIERQQSFEDGEGRESGKEEGKLLQGLVFLTISIDLLCPCSGPDPGLFGVAWNEKNANRAVVRFRNIKDQCDISMYD